MAVRLPVCSRVSDVHGWRKHAALHFLDQPPQLEVPRRPSSRAIPPTHVAIRSCSLSGSTVSHFITSILARNIRASRAYMQQQSQLGRASRAASPTHTPRAALTEGGNFGSARFNFSHPPSLSSTALLAADCNTHPELGTERSRAFTESLPPSVPPSVRNSGAHCDLGLCPLSLPICGVCCIKYTTVERAWPAWGARCAETSGRPRVSIDALLLEGPTPICSRRVIATPASPHSRNSPALPAPASPARSSPRHPDDASVVWSDRNGSDAGVGATEGSETAGEAIPSGLDEAASASSYVQVFMNRCASCTGFLK